MLVRTGAVVTLGVVLALASPGVAGAANPAPEVVPTVREWTGGSGVFQLRPGAVSRAGLHAGRRP
jgi:hypothetical protein